MRAYVICSGVLFFVILAAHAARVFMEGPGVLTNPAFAVSSVLALGMSVWSVLVGRKAAS